MNKRIRIIAIGICTVGFVLPIYISVAAALLNPSYLPIIYKQPTLSPTYQPPVLFPNGDFEQGPVIWVQFSSNGYDLIYSQQELLEGIFPYDGTWVGWLGGALNESSYIEQQVMVPSNLPYMSYWYWVVPSNPCGNSLELVLVNEGVLAIDNLCIATGGWVQKVIDLSDYAGQSVSIQIRAECDSITTSDLYVDHVAFQASLNVANHPSEVITTIDASTPKKDGLAK